MIKLFAETLSSERCWSVRLPPTDRQIDRLVYELYELTDDEIAIIEEATK